MRALRLVADRKLELVEAPGPAAPAEGEVQIRVRAVGLNHLDVWGFRGMAFAKRKLPLVVGAEASGEIAALGAGVRAIVLTNNKGAVLQLQGRQIGLMANADLSGLAISMR